MIATALNQQYKTLPLNAKKIITVKDTTYATVKRKPKKIQACWDLKLDLSNTSEGFELALANCKLVIKMVRNIPGKDEDEIFVKLYTHKHCLLLTLGKW